MSLPRNLLAGLVLLAPLLGRAEPVSDLLDNLGSFSALEGDFVQQQYSEQGEFVARSSGHFKLLKGGYFSWEITAPDSQIVIATPEFLWHHDRDLETVTRRPVAEQADMAPLKILGGEASQLREQYDIEPAGDDRFLFTPLAEKPGFRQMTLSLHDGVVSRMEITDRLNQVIQLEFSAVDTHPALAPADFDFQPPPDADLFYYDE